VEIRTHSKKRTNNFFKKSGDSAKKTMKKLAGFGIILGVLLGIFFLYLMYKTWVIFGFWTLVWTGLLSLITTTYLGNLIGSRAENNGVITYNPKELPKFLNMLVSLAIGYYLFTIISVPTISSSDYMFGLTYLILLTAVPILFAIYKLIRDRNDFIVIEGNNLKYRDNDENGDFKFTDIAAAEISGGIKLTFKDSKIVTIKTDNMNFNAKDLLSVFAEIKAKLPEEKKENVSNVI
jgi:hypothetical protein